MNTMFEIIVSGDDLENDIAAAEAALDEIARIETVLSRFDPASEVARVNREAHQHPVLISYELLEILELCQIYWEKTFGYFDITAGSGLDQRAAELHSAESHSNATCDLLPTHGAIQRSLPSTTRRYFGGVIFDVATRRISFTKPGLRLDFGAFGKGYALDCAAGFLKENGVRNAVLHGGTSSVLAIGDPATIGLRNPWDAKEEIDQLTLANQGLSSSAVFHEGQTASDIINPREQIQLREDTACVVISTTAAEAEIFSTALLCMGEAKAKQFCAKNLASDLQVLWIDNAVSKAKRVGRVTPCVPFRKTSEGAHEVTRPIIHRLTKML